MAKLVPLTKGKMSVVSDRVYEDVMLYNWYAFFKIKWYAAAKINGKHVYLHRFITNAPTGMDVDHINGDSLCNADYNLRIVTRSDNLLNKLWGNKNKVLIPYNYDPDEIYHDKSVIHLLGGGYATIDSDMWDILYPFRWHTHRRNDGYTKVVRGVGLKMLYMHRVVMEHSVGHPLLSSEIVDHINGDTSDNRISNLRIVTRQQNAFNAKISRSNNTSGYKGVTFFTSRGKYVAQITHHYKHITIGYYDSPTEAAIAYDLKSIELYGQYAKTNFPISDYSTIKVQV